MRNAHSRTWNMLKKLKNVKNEKRTLQTLEYGKNTEKRGKLEMQTVRPGIWQETLKNLENEKRTLYLGTGIWQEY